MELAAGIDFGGSAAKVGLVDGRGAVVARASVPMDPRAGFESLVGPVEGALRTLVAGRGAGDGLRVIGIGTPGFVDHLDGRIIGGCENLPGLRGRSVQARLSTAFGVPAFAENDATSAAAGERAYGAGRRFAHFVLITVGTGIGGGLVLGGRVYRGSRGFAAEIGHLCLDPHGPWCVCGSRGCFEMYASAPAIARQYDEKLRKRGAGGTATGASARDVVERSRVGDASATETLDEAGRWIAQAFGSMLNLLDLEACIVGGGVSEAGEALLGPVRRALPDFAWPQVAAGVEVLAAELRNDAGILGAAAQARERLG